MHHWQYWLSKFLHSRKQAVTSQNEELEALEAKIRQAELRLKEAKSTAKPDLASQSVGASSPPRAKPQPEGANGWQAVPTRAKAPAAGRSSSNAVSSASYAHSQRSSTITDTEYVVVEREAER